MLKFQTELTPLNSPIEDIYYWIGGPGWGEGDSDSASNIQGFAFPVTILDLFHNKINLISAFPKYFLWIQWQKNYD